MPEQEQEYTKQEAAAYLGVSVSTIWYHKRVSQKLAPGIINRFGRLVWTKAELDAFKSLELEGGRPRKKAAEYLTPHEYLEAVAEHRAPVVTLDGRRVLSIKRSKENTREYIAKTEGGRPEGGIIWNNTRLVIVQAARRD